MHKIENGRDIDESSRQRRGALHLVTVEAAPVQAIAAPAASDDNTEIKPGPPAQLALASDSEHLPLHAAAGDDSMMSSPPTPASARIELRENRWKEQLVAAKGRWSRLSEQELLASDGNEMALARLITKRYGIDHTRASVQVCRFLADPPG